MRWKCSHMIPWNRLDADEVDKADYLRKFWNKQRIALYLYFLYEGGHFRVVTCEVVWPLISRFLWSLVLTVTLAAAR